MDIISHMLAGVATATVIAAHAPGSGWRKGVLLGLGGLGAIAPDIDAITLWQGFDQNVGRLLQLPWPGKTIYFNNYWYSHHNFCHSLLGGVLFTLIMVAVVQCGRLLLVRCGFAQSDGRRPTLISAAAFFSGYLAHLAGDLPTPGLTWGGIKLLWPLARAVGGTGQIWWWNNYDIFLLLAMCCLLNLALLGLTALLRRQVVKIFVPLVYLGTVLAIFQQIHQRPVSFNYQGSAKKFAACEQQSLVIQHELLGNNLYSLLRKMDAALPIYF